MDISTLLIFGLLACIAASAITFAFHYKHQYQKNQDKANHFRKRCMKLEQARDFYKKIDEVFVEQRKKRMLALEIENFTLKQKPKFKIGDPISKNVKIIAITPVKIPITSLLKCFSPYKTLENFEYIYTLKHDHAGPAYKVPEREILKAAPEPTKEEDNKLYSHFENEFGDKYDLNGHDTVHDLKFEFCDGKIEWYLESDLGSIMNLKLVELPAPTPTPTKEEIFSVESFE